MLLPPVPAAAGDTAQHSAVRCFQNRNTGLTDGPRLHPAAVCLPSALPSCSPFPAVKSPPAWQRRHKGTHIRGHTQGDTHKGTHTHSSSSTQHRQQHETSASSSQAVYVMHTPSNCRCRCRGAPSRAAARLTLDLWGCTGTQTQDRQKV